MSQPVYLPSPPTYPMASYPAVPVMAPPGSWTARPAQTAPALASTNVVRTQQSVTPRPIIRAKGPDEPTPAPTLYGLSSSAPVMPLSIPTPEQLGIAPAASSKGADLDWTDAHRRLERLGAVGFRFDQLEQGGCHFACLLPTRQPGMTHRVEADAATSAEAVRLVLSQAEQWVSAGNGSAK